MNSRISETKKNSLLIKNLNNRPNASATYGRGGMSADEVKDVFDKQFLCLVEAHNALVEETEGKLAETEGKLAETEDELAETNESFEQYKNNINETIDTFKKAINNAITEFKCSVSWMLGEAEKEAALAQASAQASAASAQEAAASAQEATQILTNLEEALDAIIGIQEDLIDGIPIYVLPEVTQETEGYVLVAENGAYTLKDVAETEVDTYIDECINEYINDALGGEY